MALFLTVPWLEKILQWIFLIIIKVVGKGSFLVEFQQEIVELS